MSCRLISIQIEDCDTLLQHAAFDAPCLHITTTNVPASLTWSGDIFSLRNIVLKPTRSTRVSGGTQLED